MQPRKKKLINVEQNRSAHQRSVFIHLGEELECIFFFTNTTLFIFMQSLEHELFSNFLFHKEKGELHKQMTLFAWH